MSVSFWSTLWPVVGALRDKLSTRIVIIKKQPHGLSYQREMYREIPDDAGIRG